MSTSGPKGPDLPASGPEGPDLLSRREAALTFSMARTVRAAGSTRRRTMLEQPRMRRCTAAVLARRTLREDVEARQHASRLDVHVASILNERIQLPERHPRVMR